ncbi:MAG: thioredoxin [Candidatus Cloacimonetes bacterium]|nr:thioredoxin [Candidatus Cloacimonadota bacterium]
MILELNQSNFATTTEKGIVVVDFWAPWCGPCRQMNPVLTKFKENNPDIAVGKLNIDESPEIATKYNILSIPTIIIFKDGEPAEQTVGVVSEKVILEKVESVK